VKVLNTATPAIDDIVETFLDTFDDYVDTVQSQDVIILWVFVIVFTVMYLFMLLFFLRKLSGQIITTKGLLNMIPVNIIKKNKTLKKEFISPKIISAIT